MRIPAYRNEIGEVVQTASQEEVRHYAEKLLAKLTEEQLARFVSVMGAAAEFFVERMTIGDCLRRMTKYPAREYHLAGGGPVFLVDNDDAESGGDAASAVEPGRNLIEVLMGWDKAALCVIHDRQSTP